MKKAALYFLAGVAVLMASVWGYEHGLFSGRWRAQFDHRISLPKSARNIQCSAEMTYWSFIGLDHQRYALFEMDKAELSSFTNSFVVTERGSIGAGYGWWSNPPDYGRFKKTWSGEPDPITFLRCESSIADSIEVYLFGLSNTVVVELCSEWD